MAHYAEINNENIVLRVVVICNEDCINENGFESEQKGIETCKFLFGENTNWIQTSYTSRIRKHFAGAGYTYDEAIDAFIPPKPNDEYVLNEETLNWEIIN
jgi:hypothetical protein